MVWSGKKGSKPFGAPLFYVRLHDLPVNGTTREPARETVVSEIGPKNNYRTVRSVEGELERQQLLIDSGQKVRFITYSSTLSICAFWSWPE